jgi:hypothetical protein
MRPPERLRPIRHQSTAAIGMAPFAECSRVSNGNALLAHARSSRGDSKTSNDKKPAISLENCGFFAFPESLWGKILVRRRNSNYIGKFLHLSAKPTQKHTQIWRSGRFFVARATRYRAGFFRTTPPSSCQLPKLFCC